MFNVLNISFSIGTYYNYKDPSSSLYNLNNTLIGVTLIVIFIAICCMHWTDAEGYGEFKSKFKKFTICQLFIPLIIFERIFLGLYEALQNQYSYSSLIILGIIIVFVLYVLINLPFIDPIQNYRTFIIHFCNLAIIMVINYYRAIKTYTPLKLKAKIFIPALI